jgi:hypothetical protein
MRLVVGLLWLCSADGFGTFAEAPAAEEEAPVEEVDEASIADDYAARLDVFRALDLENGRQRFVAFWCDVDVQALDVGDRLDNFKAQYSKTCDDLFPVSLDDDHPPTAPMDPRYGHSLDSPVFSGFSVSGNATALEVRIPLRAGVSTKAPSVLWPFVSRGPLRIDAIGGL